MSKLRTNLSLRQNYRLTSASEAIWGQMRPEVKNYRIELFLARKFKWDNLGDFQPPCKYIIVKKVRSVIWFPFLYIMLFFLTHFDAFWQMYSVRVVSSLSQLQLLYPGIPIHQIDQAYHAWCWLRHFFTVFENIFVPSLTVEQITIARNLDFWICIIICAQKLCCKWEL